MFEIVGPPFSRDNPASVFAYSLVLDGTAGARTVSHVWYRHPTGGEPIRPWVYLSPEGGIGMPRTAIVEPLQLNVVPAPGAGAMLLTALLARRGRNRAR